MIKFTDRYVSKIAIAVVIGGAALAHPVFAQDTSNDSTQAQSGDMTKNEGGMQRVDDRIKELHDTIGVTAAQEHEWRKVTRVMRQNEENIRKLVVARNDMENASAVDDLKSYEKIAYVHDQDLRKLIPAFGKFYASLSPEQKTSADDMFSKYEGRTDDEQGNAATYNGMTPASGSDTTNGNNVPGGISGSTTNSNNPAPNAADQSTPSDQNQTK